MLIPISPTDLLAACLIIGLGALVQGSVGFGMALVSAPLLTLIDPILVPGPTIIAGMVLSVLIAFRERRAIEYRDLGAAFPGLLAGALIAAAVLSSTPIDDFGVILGGLVLVAVGLSLLGLRVPPTPSNVFYAGTLAGFMSTTASIPGPPLALVYQRASGARLRATLAPLFILCNLISLPTLAAIGRFGWVELALGLTLCPGVLAGAALSSYTARLLDRGPVRHAVLAVAAAAGLMAIWQGIG